MWAPGLSDWKIAHVAADPEAKAAALERTLEEARAELARLLGDEATRERERREADAARPDWRLLFHPPGGRGDFSLWAAAASDSSVNTRATAACGIVDSCGNISAPGA